MIDALIVVGFVSLFVFYFLYVFNQTIRDGKLAVLTTMLSRKNREDEERWTPVDDDEQTKLEEENETNEVEEEDEFPVWEI